jgi:IclR family transcriptional regulator, KDG regulon repressor
VILDTTVAKGLGVLQFLARAGGPVRLSTVAEELQLRKSNVHRLLATLTELGYVTQEPETGRYAPTLLIWELGAAVLAAHPAKRAAAPFMQELHRTTGETVSLTVLDGDDVLYLDKVLSPRQLRFSSRPGSREPAARIAAGKAMLAYEPKARAIVERSAKRPGDGPRIVVDAVMKELEQVRIKGYAYAESGLTPGVVAIAAPIMGRDDRAAAALSVSGPAERLTKAKAQAVIEAVLNVCARIADTAGRI